MKKIWIDTVSIGQEVFIHGEKYICQGVSLCESDGNSYCEFMLYSETQNKNKWLEVELVDNGNYELCLYSDIGISRYNALLKNDFCNSETYSAKATVIKCKGDFDADINEKFDYTEYYSNDKVLSVEDWYGVIEYSLGKEIQLEDVVLGEIIKNKSNKFNSKKPISIVVLVLIIFLSLVFLIPSRLFASYCSPTCTKYSKDWCCINVDKCKVTHKVCKSMYYTNSSSVRYRSYGSRNPVGGGTSFGK